MRSSYALQRTVGLHAAHPRFARRPRDRRPGRARCRPAGSLLGLTGAPARASRRWRRRSPRRTAPRWCRWTASTSPTSSWPTRAGSTARAPRRPSTPRGTPRCWPGCASGRRRVLAPAFDHRLLERRSPAPIEVPAGAGLVVTEGNYLLLDEPRWRAVRAQLDAVWHVDHRRADSASSGWSRGTSGSGKTPDAARPWVARVDQPNAELVEAAAAPCRRGAGPLRSGPHVPAAAQQLRQRIICVSAVYAAYSRHDTRSEGPRRRPRGARRRGRPRGRRGAAAPAGGGRPADRAHRRVDGRGAAAGEGVAALGGRARPG